MSTGQITMKRSRRRRHAGRTTELLTAFSCATESLARQCCSTLSVIQRQEFACMNSASVTRYRWEACLKRASTSPSLHYTSVSSRVLFNRISSHHSSDQIPRIQYNPLAFSNQLNHVASSIIRCCMINHRILLLSMLFQS